MKRAIIVAVVTILAVRSGWQVDFTARSNNVGVQLETSCWRDNKLTFIAIDYIHVDGDTNTLTFRRHDEVPRDACLVQAYVFANDEKGDTFFGADPSGDYIIESSKDPVVQR